MRHELPKAPESVCVKCVFPFREVSVWLVHTAVPGQRTGIWVLALPGLSVLLFWEKVTPKLTQRARKDFFFRKPVTDCPGNGKPKFQIHLKPRDLEPTGSSAFLRRYTNPQDTVGFQSMLSVALQLHGCTGGREGSVTTP